MVESLHMLFLFPEVGVYLLFCRGLGLEDGVDSKLDAFLFARGAFDSG